MVLRIFELVSAGSHSRANFSVEITNTNHHMTCVITADIHVITADIHVITADIHVITADIHVITADIHVITADIQCDHS